MFIVRHRSAPTATQVSYDAPLSCIAAAAIVPDRRSAPGQTGTFAHAEAFRLSSVRKTCSTPLTSRLGRAAEQLARSLAQWQNHFGSVPALTIPTALHDWWLGPAAP